MSISLFTKVKGVAPPALLTDAPYRLALRASATARIIRVKSTKSKLKTAPAAKPSQKSKRHGCAYRLPMKLRIRATALSRRKPILRKTKTKEPNDFHFNRSEGTPAGGFKAHFLVTFCCNRQKVTRISLRSKRRNAFDFQFPKTKLHEPAKLAAKCL